jgi:hypothetical protein
LGAIVVGDQLVKKLPFVMFTFDCQTMCELKRGQNSALSGDLKSKMEVKSTDSCALK